MLVWIAFGIAALGLAYGVHRLYETVRREFQEQGEVAMSQQQAKMVERVHAATNALRHATIKSLAAMHVEGLGYALRQWDDGDESVVGTFQWEESAGFLAGSQFPSGSVKLKREDLPGLWQHLRSWRVQNPNTTTAESTQVGSFRAAAIRMIDNPDFPATELGYQAENLEMLRYAGRPVDPWAGWAADLRNPAAPWVVWYQAGPEAPVRGCLIDVTPLVARLRGELTDSRLARLALVPSETLQPIRSERHFPSAVPKFIALNDGFTATRFSSSSVPQPAQRSVATALPGYVLTAGPGDLFVEKQNEARLAALAIALLLGIFVVGALFLALYSQREIRDAEQKTTFVAQVSHELRTPLTSIQMFADMLATSTLPDEKRIRFAGTIGRESRRLSALIERLLTFNALERGGASPVIETVDVGQMVRETLEEMESTLRSAGMHVEHALPAEPIKAATDRSALKQALLNLIDNALKHAREGGILRLASSQSTEGVRLRVADEGSGIPRALGARVFEPFVQGGTKLTDKSPGVGLGLSIARGGLRRAGGDLVLLPSPKGAVFEIRLPAAPPS